MPHLNPNFTSRRLCAWGTIGTVRRIIHCFSPYFCGLLLASLSACGPASYYGTGPGGLTDVESARELGLTWAGLAALSASSSDVRSKAAQVKSLLQTRDIIALQDDSACQIDGVSNVLAFVEDPFATSDIYVCPEGLLNGTELLGQVLVHEAAHLVGIKNECQTTFYEVNILQAAGQAPFENGYVASCEDSGDYDFSNIDFRYYWSLTPLPFLTTTFEHSHLH